MKRLDDIRTHLNVLAARGFSYGTFAVDDIQWLIDLADERLALEELHEIHK